MTPVKYFKISKEEILTINSAIEVRTYSEFIINIFKTLFVFSYYIIQAFMSTIITMSFI